MAEVQCARCQERKAALETTPLPGRWGEVVLAEACADCWRAWQEEQTRLINHENLRPWVPADKQLLYRKLREFLNLSIEAPESTF